MPINVRDGSDSDRSKHVARRAGHKTVVFFFGSGRFGRPGPRLRTRAPSRSRDATFEGDRPMAFSTHSTTVSSAPSSDKTTRLHLNWGERIVTAVSASVAVLIVATIAVLMGMA